MYKKAITLKTQAKVAYAKFMQQAVLGISAREEDDGLRDFLISFAEDQNAYDIIRIASQQYIFYTHPVERNKRLLKNESYDPDRVGPIDKLDLNAIHLKPEVSAPKEITRRIATMNEGIKQLILHPESFDHDKMDSSVYLPGLSPAQSQEFHELKFKYNNPEYGQAAKKRAIQLLTRSLESESDALTAVRDQQELRMKKKNKEAKRKSDLGKLGFYLTDHAIDRFSERFNQGQQVLGFFANSFEANRSNLTEFLVKRINFGQMLLDKYMIPNNFADSMVAHYRDKYNVTLRKPDNYQLIPDNICLSSDEFITNIDIPVGAAVKNVKISVKYEMGDVVTVLMYGVPYIDKTIEAPRMSMDGENEMPQEITDDDLIAFFGSDISNRVLTYKPREFKAVYTLKKQGTMITLSGNIVKTNKPEDGPVIPIPTLTADVSDKSALMDGRVDSKDVDLAKNPQAIDTIITKQLRYILYMNLERLFVEAHNRLHPNNIAADFMEQEETNIEQQHLRKQQEQQAADKATAQRQQQETESLAVRHKNLPPAATKLFEYIFHAQSNIAEIFIEIDDKFLTRDQAGKPAFRVTPRAPSKQDDPTSPEKLIGLVAYNLHQQIIKKLKTAPSLEKEVSAWVNQLREYASAYLSIPVKEVTEKFNDKTIMGLIQRYTDGVFEELTAEPKQQQ
jgi:hypothetical protein